MFAKHKQKKSNNYVFLSTIKIMSNIRIIQNSEYGFKFAVLYVAYCALVIIIMCAILLLNSD